MGAISARRRLNAISPVCNWITCRAVFMSQFCYLSSAVTNLAAQVSPFQHQLSPPVRKPPKWIRLLARGSKKVLKASPALQLKKKQKVSEKTIFRQHLKQLILQRHVHGSTSSCLTTDIKKALFPLTCS